MSAGDKLLYMYCRQEGRDKDHLGKTDDPPVKTLKGVSGCVR